MDGVGTPIIGRPRPIPGHDTPNPANNTYTLNYEEPVNLFLGYVFTDFHLWDLQTLKVQILSVVSTESRGIVQCLLSSIPRSVIISGKLTLRLHMLN